MGEMNKLGARALKQEIALNLLVQTWVVCRERLQLHPTRVLAPLAKMRAVILS